MQSTAPEFVLQRQWLVGQASAGCGIVAQVNARSEQDLGDPFEEVIDDVLRSLPAEFRSALSNFAILIEDEPPDSQRLGLYRGIPLTKRRWNTAGIFPATVTIFRGPIARLAAGDDDRLRREIRRVVLHELGHHFGVT